MVSIICFYHAPCNDGSASAAALRYRLESAGYLGAHDDIRFCPLGFNTEWDDPLPENYLIHEVTPKHEVREIYFVDIGVSRTKFDQIVEHLRSEHKLGETMPRVICIDHHETARRNIDQLGQYCDETDIRIGPGLSGATLVWHYFDRKFESVMPMPPLLSYVADQDIWEWKLPDSREINAALNTLDGHEESMYAELRRCLDSPDEWRESRKAEGKGITTMVDSQIRKTVRHTIDIEIEGMLLRVVNSSSFSSEMGNFLCDHSDAAPNVLAIIYSMQEDWGVRCSIRSIDGARINAREFAERFGGGGHNNASGCRFASFAEFTEALNGLKEKGWG